MWPSPQHSVGREGNVPSVAVVNVIHDVIPALMTALCGLLKALTEFVLGGPIEQGQELSVLDGDNLITFTGYKAGG